MSTYNYRHDPITQRTILVYAEKSDMFGVARANGSGHDFLSQNHTWIVGTKGGSHYLPSMEQAKQFVDGYIDAITRLFVAAQGVDVDAMRYSVKCPHCRSIHKGNLKGDNLDRTDAVVLKECPRTSRMIYTMIWEFTDATRSKRRPLGAPLSIPHLPKWDCKECFGSGEYVGFSRVEPCSECMPKS